MGATEILEEMATKKENENVAERVEKLKQELILSAIKNTGDRTKEILFYVIPELAGELAATVAAETAPFITAELKQGLVACIAREMAPRFTEKIIPP